MFLVSDIKAEALLDAQIATCPDRASAHLEILTLDFSFTASPPSHPTPLHRWSSVSRLLPAVRQAL